MALTKTKCIYELLYRGGPKGFVGAHVIEMECVYEDGEKIGERFFPARPITEAEFREMLGGESAALIEAADAARAELGQITEEKGALEQDLAKTRAALAIYQADTADAAVAQG